MQEWLYSSLHRNSFLPKESILLKSRKGTTGNGWLVQLWFWWENLYFLSQKFNVFVTAQGLGLSLISDASTWFVMNCYYFWKNHKHFLFRKACCRVLVGRWKCCEFFSKRVWNSHCWNEKEILLYNKACLLYRVAHKPWFQFCPCS